MLVRDPVDRRTTTFARVKVPKEMLPRFVRRAATGARSSRSRTSSPATSTALFPGMEILDHGYFRVTRDADLEVSDEADDLLRAVEAELRRRRFGEVVRVEVERRHGPRRCASQLTEALEVEERQVYDVHGLLDLNDLWQIVELPGFAELRDPPWSPVTQPRLQARGGRVGRRASRRCARGDMLVHHPYDSFSTSVERFVEQAVDGPRRPGDQDDRVPHVATTRRSIPALIRATERGKQAVCLVELKARFDERANIGWARALEEAGVHVVYGHPALKTHAKCDPRRPPRGRRRAPLRARRDRQLQPEDGAAVHRLRPLHGRRASSAPTSPTCSTSSPASRGRGATARCCSRPTHLRDGILDEIERTIAAHRARRGRRASA